MVKTNKITNLKRLNFKNKCIVLSYLTKVFFRIGPSENEKNVYIYYNLLINTNGFFLSETNLEFISEIKEGFEKRIKTRKKPKSSDIDVFKMILVSKEYIPVVETYKKHFKYNSEREMNIIDAGSNIGLTSLFFLDHFKNANIVCIEPENNNFKILEYNLQNCPENKILKINGGIWKTDTFIKIVNDFKDKLDWSFRVEETKDKNGIQAYTINTIIIKVGFLQIDILKIDIEGSEKQIFDPLISDLSFLKVTKCLAIEIHDLFDCRKQIYDVLDFYNFSYFNKGELTIAINNNLKETNFIISE
jgi:FkbM family methyltransferase